MNSKGNKVYNKWTDYVYNGLYSKTLFSKKLLRNMAEPAGIISLNKWATCMISQKELENNAVKDGWPS